MTMRRTQIYLDGAVWARIERLTSGDSRSMSEVVRAALDRYLDEEERARRPLDETTANWIGAWRDEGSYLTELQAELEDRAARLGY